MSNSILSHNPHPSHHHSHRHRLAYPAIHPPPACKRLAPPSPSFVPNPRHQYDNSKGRTVKFPHNFNNVNSGGSTDNDLSLNTVSCSSTIVDTPPTLNTDNNKNTTIFNNNSSSISSSNGGKGNKGKAAYDTQGGSASLASSVATTACSSIAIDEIIEDDFALPILKELNTLDASLLQLFSEPPNPNFGNVIIDVFSTNKNISTNGHEVLILYRGKLARRVSRYSHLLKTFSAKTHAIFNPIITDSCNSKCTGPECVHIVNNNSNNGSSRSSNNCTSISSNSSSSSSTNAMYLEAYENHTLRLQAYKSKLSIWWSQTERQFHTLRMSSFVTQLEQHNKAQCDEEKHSSLEQSENTANINREATNILNRLNLNANKTNNNGNNFNHFHGINHCPHYLYAGNVNNRPNGELKGRTPNGYGPSKTLNRPTPTRGPLPLIPGAVALGVGASTNWVRGIAVRKNKLNNGSNLGGWGGVNHNSVWNVENRVGNL